MLRAPLAVVGLAGGIAALLAAWPAQSAATPQLKLSPNNAVPACVAPARLMQHVGKLNPRLDPKFREIAAHYQKHGESLGLRWDYAFFQMLAETQNLTFASDVTKDHNNFAGIRTADGDQPDRFADVSTGVQAHLHHIRLYAGDPVARPVAKRTKQVEKFILNWSRQLKRPVTFEDMIGRWSPNIAGYARTIEAALKDYQLTHCAGEVAALAGGSDGRRSADAKADGGDAPSMAGKQGQTGRSGKTRQADTTLQAGKTAKSASTDNSSSKAKPSSNADVAPAFDAQPAPATEPVRTTSALPPPAGLGMTAGNHVALGQSAAALAPAAPNDTVDAETAGSPAGAHCKVWSASFGGDKSVLIRVSDGPSTHFTALQVNAGREKEETTAYIAAYARGGRSVGEFTSPDQAINKAFELCPKT